MSHVVDRFKAIFTELSAEGSPVKTEMSTNRAELAAKLVKAEAIHSLSSSIDQLKNNI